MGTPLRGIEFVMADGKSVTTEYVLDETNDSHLRLYLTIQHMHGGSGEDNNNKHEMLVGFDTEWSQIETPNGKYKSYVSLLKLFTRIGCLLIRLDVDKPSVSRSLLKFFAIKDVIFAGVHIKKDLEKLREDYGIEVRNAVELSELAADVYKKPKIGGYGVRELAGEICSLRVDPRPLNVIWSYVDDWSKPNLTVEQMECATIDAYATYMIAKKLLGKVDRVASLACSSI